MTISIEVTIENFAVYRRGEKLLVYIVARQEQALIKLFSDQVTATDLFKIASCNARIQFDVTINKNLTTMYKGMTLPFYDFKSYKTSTLSPASLGSCMTESGSTDTWDE